MRAPTLQHIREVVASCFAQKRVQPLLALLGFPDDVIPFETGCYHGSRGVLAAYSLIAETRWTSSEIARVAHRARMQNPAQLQLYVFAGASFDELVVASFGLGTSLLTLTLQCGRERASDLEALQEMLPAADEVGIALAARHARALDRSRVTERFFQDFAAQRDRVGAEWLGLPAQQRSAREQLALLLLSRLMFLYFLQHREYLAGDCAYLKRRLAAWLRHKHRTTFYRGRLRPLFFSVLNCRPDRRAAAAKQFGNLPYLNGGLFERHALERKHRLDLPDSCTRSVFDDLLERYRFTAREPGLAVAEGVHDVGVDPEMLGRVFEGLMAERTRETTGTFYTPAATVDHVVRESLGAYLTSKLPPEAAETLVSRSDASGLDAEQRVYTDDVLRKLKVLDPACGSGAFLLGSLTRLAQARHALSQVDVLAIRRDIVAHNLFGVDLQNDAAQLCGLRLWLALVPDQPARAAQPLPHLDRQIRQGDSLVDAIDLRAASSDPAIASSVRQLACAGAQYVSVEPEQRARLQRALHTSERTLARAWISALQRRIAYQSAELRATRSQKDLFGQRTTEAQQADSALAELRERNAELKRLARGINAQNETPFFSYAVHFAEAALSGFDIVVCNPPWVRSHNWTAAISALVRRRYEICRAAAWQPPFSETAAAGGKQIDLALLFLERAVQLLAPGGVLGIILPAKFMRSLSGAGARRLLLREMEIVSVEDHSLDQRSIFHAASFATLLVARKRSDRESATSTAVTIVHRKREPLRFSLAAHELPLLPNDTGAPWLIVPPEVRAALRQLSQGRAIGADSSLTLRRGVVTGANHATVLTQCNRKLGGLAEIRAEGYDAAAQPGAFEAVIEQAAVRPLVRGCDIKSWRSAHERDLICSTCTPANTPRAARYLALHECALPTVRVTGKPMVAWQDIANDLRAAVVPAGVVALNTVYFIATDEDTAHVLCAYFNSTPFRTFAKCLAERAKDAHFRFFAWTIALLPLPTRWREFETARLSALSRQLHDSFDADLAAEIDAIVARAYGLSAGRMRALREFDKWLALR